MKILVSEVQLGFIVSNILYEQEDENMEIVPEYLNDHKFLRFYWYLKDSPTEVSIDKKPVGQMNVILNYPDYFKGKNAKTAFVSLYVKYNDNINGYRFIKKCIDYLLNLGYSVISAIGLRTPHADRVWNKLKEDYVIVEHPNSYVRAGDKYIDNKEPSYTIQELISKR